MTCLEGTRRESPEGTSGVRGNSVMTGLTVMRGISEMTEDTMLHARLRATVSVSGLRCLLSARASLLQLAAEDGEHLHQRSGKDWLALAQEEDTTTSLRPGTVAHRAVASLPVESAHLRRVV